MKIEVLGGAREVGGSCISVETDSAKVALDYGTKLEEEMKKLPRDFDAVVISHAHLDHTGSLLSLCKNNSPTIIGSDITREVTVDLLHDMVKIQNEKGVFDFDDSTAEKVGACWWNRDSVALPGLSIKLQSAGHVAGAKITSLESENKRILYTGDICMHDTEILQGCRLETLPKKPDVLITESTYGGKVRLPREELVNQFMQQLHVTMKRGGNVLIPTFAFHRSQEMAKRIDYSHASWNTTTLQRLHNLQLSPQNKRLLQQEQIPIHQRNQTAKTTLHLPLRQAPLQNPTDRITSHRHLHLRIWPRRRKLTTTHRMGRKQRQLYNLNLRIPPTGQPPKTG